MPGFPAFGCAAFGGTLFGTTNGATKPLEPASDAENLGK
jgi:hypothetical protein